jgi:tetratricopeptide (TPR) repeat protein
MKRHTLQAVFLVTLITLTLASHLALALDDGGGRSVFARGAGERALAMGGAFGAIADGPSAMIWNPAGLAHQERKSLYASHSNLIGMGFSEQAGLFALPHWKWGTLGVGFRRFGVDGIEGRDDRGGIFDENLKDAESELLLGYGRKLGTAWDLGLTFKYQQHELAGYSDGAPGLDFGVIVKPLAAMGHQADWAENLNVGFAIRNLLEPNLRLVEEGVKDPTGLRMGLAYDGVLSQHLQLTVAADAEKTREMDTRLHAGAEVRLMDLLALRVGSNSGMMTAGAGFQVASLSCDYAFEDNPLETVHRFGMSMAFGATTEATRQAKLQAQEAEMREQLAAAFLKESGDRVQTMVAQARRDVQEGDFDEALGRIETIRVLDPDCTSLEGIEAAAFFGLGENHDRDNNLSSAQVAFQRCLGVDPQYPEAAKRLQDVADRSNSQAARSEALRSRFELALQAYANGDLVAARDGFTSILEMNPEDREAAALLANTQKTLELRAEAFMDQGRARALAQDFSGARKILEQAATLAPGHPDLPAAFAQVDGLEKQARQALQAAEANTKARAQATTHTDQTRVLPPAPPMVPSFAALSTKDRAEVADLYQSGLQAVEDNRHADAIGYWELVWSRAPDYQQVAENLKQQYLALGMENFADGRLDESIRIWEKALQIDSRDKRTQGYLARAYEHKTRIREIKDEH